MRSTDYRDLLTHYSAKCAEEAFEDLKPEAVEWLYDAAHWEHGDSAHKATREILVAAVELLTARDGSERFVTALADLRRAAGNLRWDYADQRANEYVAEADDEIRDRNADETDRAWEEDAENRALEAYNAALRG